MKSQRFGFVHALERGDYSLALHWRFPKRDQWIVSLYFWRLLLEVRAGREYRAAEHAWTSYSSGVRVVWFDAKPAEAKPLLSSPPERS